MVRSRKPAAKAGRPSGQAGGHLYTVEVFLLSGPIKEKFARKNPVVSCTIQIRGDQTLEDLHHAVFDAYGRWEEHMYEFQFGKGPMELRLGGTSCRMPWKSRKASPTRR